MASRRALRGARCVYGNLPIALAMASCGLDYIYLDQQHGTVSSASVVTLSQALAGYPGVLLVRLASQSPIAIGRALDAGAHGVIVPDVETGEQARAAVAATRYPPAGTRSWGSFAMPVGLNQRAHQPDTPICIPMIESADGVRHAQEIASTPGVDGLYVGRFDLALALGCSFDKIGHPGEHDDAVELIHAACDRAGVVLATSGEASELLRQGYRMLTLGSELDFIRAALDRALGGGV